jgi:DNA-binding IclR family transcriptional regulator
VEPSAAPPYQAHVPAVARAVRALEHLASAQRALSLSSMARALEIGPSSLLAILNTLRAQGLVIRSNRDGRYLPGPALVALGTAAAQSLEPLHVFDMIADDVVDRVGESTLLFIQQGDGLTLAAAREGTHPLRYVPPLGLRVPTSGWTMEPRDGTLQGELERDVWLIAAPLDSSSLLAVVGPAARLSGGGGERAREALRAVVGGEAPSIASAAGPIERGELDAFLSQALVASLSYLSQDGYPASVPLWYDWDGQSFWLVASPGAEWAQYVRRNPRVSLSISESAPPLRRVLARGPIVTIDNADPNQWRSVERHLAERYARLDPARLLGARSPQTTSLLRLSPQQLIAWRGLVRPPSTSIRPARTA